MGITSQLNRHYRILIKQGRYPICYLCGRKIKKPNELSSDHILPKALGGATVEENLAPTHKCCNNAKGMLTVRQWFDLQAQRQRS